MRVFTAIAFGILTALLLAAPTAARAQTCHKNPDCQDGNPCTVDRCNKPTKTCTHTPASNGTVCNDANACTRTDVCQAGACVGKNPVTCTAADQCHVAGTCDAATGVCSNPTVADGTACTDYNLCTQTDVCQAGSCAGGNPKSCSAIDACHLVGTCEPTTGFCSNPPVNAAACTAVTQCNTPGICDVATGACTTPTKTDGTTCNDGNSCTQTDACSAGVCTGGNPVACTAAGPCVTAGTCDALTGLCTGAPLPDGTACSDADACTQTDLCQGGSCVGTNSVACAVSDQCHDAGACDPATGLCSTPTAPDGTPCTDYDLCTQTDVCQGGSCSGSNPLGCTAIDACHLAGTCEPTTGFCSNPPVNAAACTAVTQCNSPGTCDPATGACTTPDKVDGSTCNDGDACTQTDTCTAGACTGANPIDCSVTNPCVTGGTCDALTGLCNGTPVDDGTVCSTGAAVTCEEPDACLSGVCVAGGGGDQDGDGVCDASDDCPDIADPVQHDLDGDGAGDVCDTTDAPLAVARATLKIAKPTTAANGHLVARGTIVANPATDTLAMTGGVVVVLADATGPIVNTTFAPSECTPGRGGKILCRRASDRSSQLKLRPQPGGSGTWRFAMRLGHLAVATIPTAPRTLTITTDGMIDRVTTLSTCRSIPAGMTCVP